MRCGLTTAPSLQSRVIVRYETRQAIRRALRESVWDVNPNPQAVNQGFPYVLPTGGVLRHSWPAHPQRLSRT
ncbi:MAG: hypothetical protein QOE12_2635 [Mycobacterium sp.]|nr:hypothetical protein [Mycobacterium sp.]